MRNLLCPHLPQIDGNFDASITRRHGAGKGGAFYRDALRYAQSKWIDGKPAQALLQLNKAWMSDLSEAESATAGPPYQALRWIMAEAASGERGYLGNPVRHFLHLASRMSGPRAEVRAWRAWVCFHLAESVLARDRFPRDGVQLAREGLWIPSISQALDNIRRIGWQSEAEIAERSFGKK